MRWTALLLWSLLSAVSGQAREFDWVIVDSLVEDANPSFAQSSLALAAGGPVRARLTHADQSDGLHFLGDYKIEHFNPAGALIWSAALGGKVHVKNLCVDGEDAIILHGSFRDTLWVDANQHLLDASGHAREFLLKFDAAREVEWLLDPSDLVSIDALTVDPLDRVWIGASTGQASEVRRLDAAGETEATYVQTGPRGITGLAAAADGVVWAAGPSFGGPHSFNGMPATAPFQYNCYLVKYAPGGQGEWARFIEDVTLQAPRVASDGSGSIYFAGELNGPFAFGDWVAQGVDWVYDFFLTKVDDGGEFLWLREVPMDGFTGDAGHGKGAFLSCPDDTSVYFAGFSRNSVDWGGDANPPPGYGAQDVLVLQFSAAGEFRWAKTAGSDWMDVADALAVDAGGKVYLAGQVCEGARFDEQVFGGTFLNTFIASLPPDSPTSAGEAPPGPPLRLSIHPNPFNPATRIRFRLAAPGSVSLKIFDPRGARLATLTTGRREAGEHLVDWDGRDEAGRSLPSGLYLCRLEAEGAAAVGRMLLIR